MTDRKASGSEKIDAELVKYSTRRLKSMNTKLPE